VNETERAWRGGSFKADLALAKTGNDIRDGLEVKATDKADTPKEMERVDPGWSDFVARQESVEASEMAAWDVAATATGDLVVREAQQVVEESYEDEELVNAALNVATQAPERYAEFLQSVVENYDESFAQQVHFAASNVLAQSSAAAGEQQFQEYMAFSEEANARDAEAALARLAARRGMSRDEVQRVAAAYRGATGEPLRMNLLAVMPEDRDAFLGELAVQAEVDAKTEPMRQFKASFFTGGTDIADGLKIRGERAGGDLPPAVLDPTYNAHLVEQQVRREDAERSSRPSRESRGHSPLARHAGEHRLA